MSKTPEELAVRYSDLREFADRRLDHKAKLLLEQGFLAGYQAAQPQWISVKERLPEEGEEVLVFGQCLNDPAKVLGVRSRYKGDQDWKYTWEGLDEWVYRENDVSHWMPLPSVEGLKHED